MPVETIMPPVFPMTELKLVDAKAKHGLVVINGKSGSVRSVDLQGKQIEDDFTKLGLQPGEEVLTVSEAFEGTLGWGPQLNLDSFSSKSRKTRFITDNHEITYYVNPQILTEKQLVERGFRGLFRFWGSDTQSYALLSDGVTVKPLGERHAARSFNTTEKTQVQLLREFVARHK